VKKINPEIIVASGVMQLTLILFFIFLLDKYFNEYPIREHLTFLASIATMACGDLFVLSHIRSVKKYNESLEGIK